MSDGRQRVEHAAEALLRYPFWVWCWGDSVGFEGLIATDRLLSESRYSSFCYGIAKAWVARRQPFSFLDQTAPGAALCELAVQREDEPLLSALGELATHLRNRPRTVNGVFHHFDETPVIDGSADGEGPGVFVDCMHFDGPFFASLARATNDRELSKEAALQLVGQVELLQDPNNGLFHHFWLERKGQSNGIAWGRGQGWALLGLVSSLEQLPGDIEGRTILEEAVRRQAKAMRAHQLETGGWPTIVDDPDSYEETSTGCFMTAAFLAGIRLGALDESYRESALRAWERALSFVDDTGLVRGISDGTSPGFAVSHYREIPIDVLVPWGQGPFLLAAQAADEIGALPMG